MILARCPACATTFRVRPEQLRARQGRVRCGHCQHAFNALETLVDEGLVDDTAGAHAPVEPAPIGLASIEPAPAEPASTSTGVLPFLPIRTCSPLSISMEIT